jgi:hypothetical protein
MEPDVICDLIAGFDMVTNPAPGQSNCSVSELDLNTSEKKEVSKPEDRDLGNALQWQEHADR